MAESNLGSYKVVVSADYQNFLTSIDVVLKSVQSTADNLVAKMSNMTNAIGKSMGEITASTKTMAAQTTEQIGALNQSLNSINTTGTENSMRKTTNETNNLSQGMRKAADSGNLLTSVFSKMKSHLEWMAGAVVLGGILAIPAGINHIAESTEALNAKIRQNLELSEQYHGNNRLLDADMQRLTEISNTYAVGFGAEINEVQEAMQILSRRFKDVESISYLTSVALTMNRLDFVDLKSAASNLEAVMLQFGLSAKGTKQFLNDFTIAVHSARITGQELLDALQRSGSAFKGFNMDTREAIAAVAALSTETARTGSVIGQSFKSIASNFDTKKAVEALEAYNIKLYDVNENGMKVIRKGANIFGELQNLFSKLDDEGKRKLALTLAGGKYQVNQLMAFLEDAHGNFNNIMNEMENKSSDEMTQELLKTSMGTYQTKIMQAKASLEVFARTIGNTVLPYLKMFMDHVTATAMYLQQHAQAVLTVGKVIVALAGAYAAVRLAMMGASIAMGIYHIVLAACTGTVSLAAVSTWALQAANVAATISTFAQIAATEGLAAALVGLQIAFPPLLVLSAIILALAGTAYVVYNNWESVKPALINTWNTIVNGVATVIEFLVTLFPALGAAIYVVKTIWEAEISYLTGTWKQFSSILSFIIDAIYNMIVGLSAAWEPFVQGAKDGISRFASAIGDLVTSILPEWANSVLRIFADLGNKVSNMAAQIGRSIRNALTIGPGSGNMGDYKQMENGVDRSEESPYQKAQRESKAAFERLLAGNVIPEQVASAPSIGNQIPESGSKGRSGKGDTAYQQAKKEYDAAVAKAKFESESNGKFFSANDQLQLYNSMLGNVPKVNDKKHQETFDFEKGQYDLMTKANKEHLELKKAQLETAIAAEKVTKRDAFDKEIEMLSTVRDQALIGSVDRERAEQNLLKKIKERDDYEISIAKKKSEINKQYLADLQALIDKQIEFNEKLQLISIPQKIAYQNQQNESTYKDKQSENENAIGKTAVAGKESEMIAAYRAYINAVTELDRENAYNKVMQVSKSETKTQEILYKGLQVKAEYAKKEQQIFQQTFEYQNRYQIAFINAYSSGITESLNGILNKTTSFANSIRNIFKGLWKALSNQFATDFANKWTQNLSKMIFGSKDADKKIKDSKTQLTDSVAELAQKELNAEITKDNTKSQVNASTNAAVQASSAATKTSVISDIGAMMVQMLEMMAIMFVVSALFGGGGSSKSEKTESVSLGRNPASYYTTPSGVSNLTVPSFDIGAEQLPEDMLAMVHKDEMILTPETANNIRNIGKNAAGNIDNGGSDGRPIIVKSNYSPNLIDSRGVEKMYKQNLKQLSKTIVRAGRYGTLNKNSLR